MLQAKDNTEFVNPRRAQKERMDGSLGGGKEAAGARKKKKRD